MDIPDHTTAEALLQYANGQVLADSAGLQWPGFYVRILRFPRVVDQYLVPATAEPLMSLYAVRLGKVRGARAQRGMDHCAGRPVSQAIGENDRPLNWRIEMEIKRIGSRPSGKGPAEYFTGTVRVDPLFEAKDSARTLGAYVTFEPGARTAWHTHPLGQTLIVTAGCGRAQRWGGPIEEIRPGDVIWFPAGEKHWHGAAPTTAMTHIAIVEQLDGKNSDWMEKVSDEQYGAGSEAG